MSDDIGTNRAELLALRARLVVTERAALAALEAMLLIRPEQLTIILEAARKRLAVGYLDNTFASDLSDPAERAFVAREVERLMRALQDEMGFEGGISASENG
jgi:chorismate-pyruvate lyase